MHVQMSGTINKIKHPHSGRVWNKCCISFFIDVCLHSTWIVEHNSFYFLGFLFIFPFFLSFSFSLCLSSFPALSCSLFFSISLSATCSFGKFSAHHVCIFKCIFCIELMKELLITEIINVSIWSKYYILRAKEKNNFTSSEWNFAKKSTKCSKVHSNETNELFTKVHTLFVWLCVSCFFCHRDFLNTKQNFTLKNRSRFGMWTTRML